MIVLILAALLSPWIGWGAFHALQIEIDDTTKWVPADFPVRRDYDRFTERFENGDVLVISWNGCTIDDPRLERLVTTLRNDSSFGTADGKPYLERIATGAEFLRTLTEPPLQLSRKEATERLRGSVLGPDGRTTWAVLTFSKAGVKDRTQAVLLIRKVLDEVCDIPAHELHMAGPIIDGYEVQRASNESLRLYAPLSALVILLACWWSLKSLRVALIVFGLSFFCEGVTLALVHYGGHHVSPLMIVMPPLILVLGVSGGIHLVNYYYDALRTGTVSSAPRRALAIGWLPCVLSAGTTAIGLGSLLVSDLQPIREFGLYSAVGVLLTLAALFLIVPGAFELWPVRSVVERSEETAELATTGQAAGEPLPDHPPRTYVYSPWLRHISLWLCHHHAAVATLSIAAMIAAAWGVPRVTTSVRIDTLFGKDSRFLADHEWLEAHIGPLVPIEVLVRFDANCSWTQWDRLQRVTAVQRELRTVKRVGSTLSAATFFPDISDGSGTKGVVARTVANRKLESARSELARSGFVRDTPEDQQWRITARVSSLADIHYDEFLDIIRRHVTSVLSDDQGSAGVSFSVTGVVPVIQVIQGELLRDLFASFLSAFGIITVVMMINQRSILAGLVSMIPNVFPMAVMFGLLGWLERPMDIGSVMTASVALGMAIDGTLHFLTFFRRGLAAGETTAEAVQSAYDHCAPAMTESSVICALGLLMFVFGSFLPTQRFAWMMVSLITAAWIGDLVLLPALLAGPVGSALYGRAKLHRQELDPD